MLNIHPTTAKEPLTVLDRTDARILLALDDDPQATVVALAERLTLARNTVQSRIRRMEADGVLAPVSVRARHAAAGYPVLAFLTLAIDQADAERTLADIAEVPEVCEAHAITGDGDLLVRVIARDTPDLHRITLELLRCHGVARSSTAIAMVESIPFRMAPALRRTL
ncbi:Lrp/AsnC family transcriptional regulator [Pseudonocardia sp. WMMC193]|uniref:Lrp/AsnC family transcriptional regulator n=1 Tax=Pseudonocardia sp. WMMC193 TaxID=2911965 RepID=UPI001F3C1F6B|nr:Lrp/AsnC family transcriptional regulator [Pseudonocardia sp. WMMC193]MCF7549821.1 Lrp/AsnC family transcriptional regulator [Pseudonocardia sp. WMMC193]